MNEKLVCENVVQKYSYKYYLVESEYNLESTGSIKMYGMKIDSYDLNSNLVDTKTVANILSNKEEMIKCIGILKRFEVTPVTLEDVIIDNIY